MISSKYQIVNKYRKCLQGPDIHKPAQLLYNVRVSFVIRRDIEFRFNICRGILNMYYSSIGILALIVHLIINFEAMKKSERTVSTPSRARYRAFLLSICLYYFADASWGLAYDSGIIPVTYGITILFFFSVSLTVLLWMRFIITYLNRKNVFSQILKYAGGGIFLLQMTILVINFFWPVMFKFEANGEYVPGIARYSILGLQTILFGIITFYPLYYSHDKNISEKEKLHNRAIGHSGIMMTTFIILQNWFPLMPMYAIGCLLATCVIHSFVIMDQREEMDSELGNAKEKAYKDPLTNVRNKTAYMETKTSIDARIKDGQMNPFGIVVFDVNDLKKVNDFRGLNAGDQYLKDASHIICEEFKHSPVFRIGGDEFVALVDGTELDNIEDLEKAFEDIISKNKDENGIVIASGMDVYKADTDKSYDDVFNRADARMHARKKALKGNEPIR